MQWVLCLTAEIQSQLNISDARTTQLRLELNQNRCTFSHMQGKGKKSKQMVSNKLNSNFKPFKVRDIEADSRRERQGEGKMSGSISSL